MRPALCCLLAGLLPGTLRSSASSGRCALLTPPSPPHASGPPLPSGAPSTPASPPGRRPGATSPTGCPFPPSLTRCPASTSVLRCGSPLRTSTGSGTIILPLPSASLLQFWSVFTLSVSFFYKKHIGTRPTIKFRQPIFLAPASPRAPRVPVLLEVLKEA